MLKNFSIVRPVVTAQEAEIKIYDLAAAAEWDIVNQYNFQMEGQPEVQSIDLAQLSALFGDAWQDTKSISCAMGYTVDANGTFYSWVPVYYEDAQGQIYQDALYLYVDVVYPGQDKEYIQGKIYYAFDDGFHTESYIIADPVRVSQFLKMVVDEAALTAGQEDANSYYYDLKLDSSGSNVKKIQAALVEKGYLSSSVDGYFGPVTEAAVKAYQKDMGLKETGVADENLQRMLLSDANEKQLLAQWLQKHQ
ncbi:MAG: peptidoglycan-binding protein [Clostridiales bacterium]|nr:peptidoglycan-binding protein [Clostridiales bacterium]